MPSNELLTDAFERIKDVVHQTVEGLSIDELTFRPDGAGNSIGWLVWHLTRIQDDHIADVARTEQLWALTWSDKFGLSLDKDDTGYGHTSGQVASVKVSAGLLLGYYDAVHAATIKYIDGLKTEDYARIVDTRWDPPVTLAVRLVSVLSDDLQHAGQAAYVKGLLPDNAGKEGSDDGGAKSH